MAALAGLGLATPFATGHSWVEQLRNLNDKGEYIGEYGYARGMVSKTDPGFSGFSMNYLLPAIGEKSLPFIGDETLLCAPTQREAKQSSDKYPRLQAAPGKFIAMRYTENGHTTLVDSPTNLPKPKSGGTIFVYGTTDPKPDEKLVNVMKWTEDGQGGDKRGFIVGMNDFDDGRCYEMPQIENANNPNFLDRHKKYPDYAMGQVPATADTPGQVGLFCETDVKIPKDAQTGKPLTLYWVWQWNTMPGKDAQTPNGKSEYYTTCIDVDIVDAVKQDTNAKYALGQQDAWSKAPDGFASRTALYTDAIKAEPGPYFSKSGSGSSSGGSAPAASTTAPAASSSKPAALPTTLAIVTSPAGSKPSNPASNADGIPMISSRPGRPQHTNATLPNSGDSSNNVVTVTDTVLVTVTAPAVTATPRARRDLRPGAKFRGMSTSED
ncbi:hypothetical protein P280DRAFT_390462 [Massarina eburnea CBS 473.64]|uniref:DUF7492 domain-containing protein n=1 Tax=Massarina eburnea CBS 473.64 TaxID=1395130 RepID=A0A6A6S9L7_9PLEO|nr:hypothetical protein P280DRAFT_390462 [Massarina eburnea CBS 473.64]